MDACAGEGGGTPRHAPVHAFAARTHARVERIDEDLYIVARTHARTRVRTRTHSLEARGTFSG